MPLLAELEVLMERVCYRHAGPRDLALVRTPDCCELRRTVMSIAPARFSPSPSSGRNGMA